MTTLLAMGGLVVAIGLAGFVRDRVKGRRTPPAPNGAGGDDPTIRYYRDVGDSTFGGHSTFGGPH